MKVLLPLPSLSSVHTVMCSGGCSDKCSGTVTINHEIMSSTIKNYNDTSCDEV